MTDQANEREQKLLFLHDQLSNAIRQRGRALARRDTPDEFRRAMELHAGGAGRFQLRTDEDDEFVTWSEWLIDDAGEPLVRVFAIRAQRVTSTRTSG